MDFRELIAPSLLVKMKRERQELARMTELDDRALADALIGLARQAREIRGPADMRIASYTDAMLGEIIPDIARRLDPDIDLTDAEIDVERHRERRFDCRTMDGQQYRSFVGYCLANTQMNYGLRDADQDARAISLLSRMSQHGNPVIIALDRLVPAGPRPAPPAAHDPETYHVPSWDVSAAERPDLDGCWVMGVKGEREFVVTYRESLEEAGAAATALLEPEASRHPDRGRVLDCALAGGASVTLDIRNCRDEVLWGPFEIVQEVAEPCHDF